MRAKLAAQKRNATVATKPPAEQPPEHPVPLEPFVQGSSIEGPSNVNASNTESNSLVGSLADTGVDVEDMEHLQLSLQEAFFLAWALGCLEILHPSTVRYTTLHHPATESLSVDTTGSIPISRRYLACISYLLVYTAIFSVQIAPRGGCRASVETPR